MPQSALNILCTNQQIHKEAMKLFYHENDLVFSAPETLQPFMSSLGDGRLDSLRSVTLFWIDPCHRIEGPSDLKLKDNIFALRLLSGLRKFHILVEMKHFGFNPSNKRLKGDPNRVAGVKFPAPLPGAKDFFMFKNLTDIACRHLPAEDCRPYVWSAKGLHGAYRHFSHGLLLAQKGPTVSKLFTHETWHEDVLWPVLDGSTCGVQQGCACGMDEDDSDWW